MSAGWLALGLLLGGLAAPVPAHAAGACSAETMAALLAPASDPNEAITLDCQPALDARSVVQKRIVLRGDAARDLVIDCRGGRIGRPEAQPSFPNPTLAILSERRGVGASASWSRPSGITIRNCTVAGPIRIWGLGPNGQGELVRLSSHSLGHTERAQAAAPHRITIEDSILTASGQTPLYLGPGVTEVTLRTSRIIGQAPAIAIYFDAESARNRLIGNLFEISTGREVVAVDGSAHNLIENNIFRIGWRGGIYLYRNCGEGGTVRHQTPSFNVIRSNRFVYAGPIHLPAISVGARGGWSRYCDEDRGYPFGSSADDGDHATDNVVEGNVIE